MQRTIEDTLRALNNGFYRDNRTSFSASRHNSWPGWNRCLDTLGSTVGSPAVLDVACGNLRLERYLRSRVGLDDFAYTGVDSSMLFDALPHGCRFVEADLLDAAMENDDALAALVGARAFDFSACFGFLHHVATQERRARVVRQMLACTRRGGVVAVSLWRFADVEELARKAEETTALAVQEFELPPMPEGDYLVGWQNKPGAWRYCHSFDDDEASWLADCAGERAELVDRFDSDGRNGAMNTYLVWRAR